MPAAKPIKAYSYVRFSTPAQAAGDSLRRQTERAEAYARQRGWTLDRTLTLRDLGVSAFRGKNALVGNLRTFLDAVEQGTVAPGSALIVESVDRISRQGIDEGYDLCKAILKKGVHIVTLSPERDFGPESVKSLTKGALEIQLILERAAEESERKSDRNGHAWAQKLKGARESGELLTRQLPLWIEARGGRWVENGYGKKTLRGAKLHLIRERAAVVKQVFCLAAGGYGLAGIVKKLTADGIPAWGRSKVWVRAYLALMLKDRRALGEYQPCGAGRKPVGEPIKDYFPPVVTEQEFYAARAGAQERKRTRGRLGGQVNVFQGLIFRAGDGDKMFATKLAASKGGHRVLVPTAATEGRAPHTSFRLDILERAILALLPQLNPAEVIEGDKPDPAPALEAALAGINGRLAKIREQLLTGDVEVLAGAARDLEAKQKDLERQLDEARQAAARPVADAWAELRGAGHDTAELPVPGGTLPSIVLPPELSRYFVGGRRAILPALDGAEDQEGFRLRLRSVLRRIIKRIDLLVTSDGADRLAAVHIHLADGLRPWAKNQCWPPWAIHIQHRPPRANANGRRPGRWWAWWSAGKDLSTAKGRTQELAALLALRVRDGDTFREGAGAATEEIP
jgi:DNA invertase Pin-like site-specific DNA recombinase